MSKAAPVERQIEDVAGEVIELSPETKIGFCTDGGLVIENVDGLLILSDEERAALRRELLEH